MKYIILILILLSGCGKIVPDEITINHKFALDDVKAYFGVICKNDILEENSSDEEVMACQNRLIGEFINNTI